MSPTPSPAYGRAGRLVVCISTALGLLLPIRALSCDIPVWQYALNNWGQDVYTVYRLHSGALARGDAAVDAAIVRAAEAGGANIGYEAVDFQGLSDVSAQAGEVARWYREARLKAEGEAREGGAAGLAPLPAPPLHVVVNPRGAVVAARRLDMDDVRRLLDSPARAALCEQLAQESGGALLVLTGDDEQENRRVTELVQAAVAQATEKRPLSSVEVRRDDPREDLFVAQLLSLEPDLADIPSVMVFAVFGRSHAMEPYIGRGVTAEGVTQMVDFLCGPCTCQIKENGGGMDLLTSFDWQSRFGAHATGIGAPGGFVTFDTE